MSTPRHGPTIPITKEIHAMKYRSKGESFEEGAARFCHPLSDSTEHFRAMLDITLKM